MQEKDFYLNSHEQGPLLLNMLTVSPPNIVPSVPSDSVFGRNYFKTKESFGRKSYVFSIPMGILSL